MGKVKLNISCPECENKFILQYQEELVESTPTFCPWCTEYFSEQDSDDKENEDEYIEEDDE